MTIIATAPVPRQNNLAGLDTLTNFRPVPAALAVCPTWCNRDHAGDELTVAGIELGLVHEVNLAELPAKDPAWLDQPATVSVLVERTSEAGSVVTADRVVLSVAEGAEGAHPGEQDCQGWTGTVEQVEALAAALLEAARIIRAGGPR